MTTTIDGNNVFSEHPDPEAARQLDEKSNSNSNSSHVEEGERSRRRRRGTWISLQGLLLKGSAALMRMRSSGGNSSSNIVELRGVLPVPLEERTWTNYSSYFSIWACMNINLLPITFGMLGPSSFGLGLRDCALVIIFFCFLTGTMPAYLGTLGPKTGMRQMTQARFSFGRWGVGVPAVLNLATLTGFCVVSCVVGGQCLAAASASVVSVSDSDSDSDGVLMMMMTPVVGIVVVGLACLAISFCGYRVLHLYERYAWIPGILAFAITAGCGGRDLARAQQQQQQQQQPATATAAGVLSFAMVIASYMIPYAAMASDFTTYLNPRFPSWRLFLYGFAGLTLPAIPLMILGAAIGAALPSIPAWEQGYETNFVGGVLAAMLSPAGGFGKFVLVILSLTVIGNNAATLYSITLNFQILVPQLVHVPRYAFSFFITAIIIPVSIRAAAQFYTSLGNFIAVISYWSSAFVAVLMAEHLVFRRTYEIEAWNAADRLPWGAAALTAAALSFALVVPSMAQAWFTGPIAKSTGDIGFELAFAVTALLYIPLRAVEKRLSGR